MSRFQNPPIARHDALAPFSRDHYSGLVKARHLIKAADADAVARRKAVAEFIDGWEHEIAEHFDDEERLLLDLLDDDDRQRLIDEHRALREFAQEARTLRTQVDPDPQTVRKIGQALDDHIRWEERELFQRLQDRLTEEQLQALHDHTGPIEQSRPRNTDRQCRARRGDDGDSARHDGDDAS